MPVEIAKLLTHNEIAIRIAAVRGSCHYISVYRTVQRLKIQPVTMVGPIKLYSEAQADQVAAALRKPNRPTSAAA
ncbi:MAG TPA: hypothetical protein VF614_13455 [Chthoniobacteraceae bacterium]|jgi:hypothetical protein